MFMRIAWGRVKPGHWEAYKADYERAIAGPAPDGLVARYLIKDLDREDAGFSITFWASEEAMDVQLNEPRHDAVRSHFTGEYNITRCQVEAGGPLSAGRAP